MVGAVALLVAVGRDADGDKQRPYAIDERSGTYRGVRMGMRAEEVEGLLGEPGEGGFMPLGEDFADVGGPPAVRGWPPDDRSAPTSLRYDGVAFLVGSRGVFAFIVTDAGARTARGVAVGDPLARARARYELGCSIGVGGEPLPGRERNTYPTCRGTIDARRRIWFGRNPIRSVTVARVGAGDR